VLKLGRKAVVTDSRTLRIDRYITDKLAPPPAARDWSRGIKNWGELLNDQLGNCTCAAIGHAVQVWTANASKEADITDAEVLAIYEKWCGYVPGNPATDQGGVMLYVLKDFKAQGFAGYSLSAFATVLPANRIHVQQAVNLFIGCYVGLNVPQYIMPEDGNVPQLWNVDPGADNTIIGGHCVYMVGYQPHPQHFLIIKFISWGAMYTMTWAFWTQFVDEAYALISPAMVGETGEAPNGFDMAQLESDLVEIN
jgi:hypothetical protein